MKSGKSSTHLIHILLLYRVYISNHIPVADNDPRAEVGERLGAAVLHCDLCVPRDGAVLGRFVPHRREQPRGRRQDLPRATTWKWNVNILKAIYLGEISSTFEYE